MLHHIIQIVLVWDDEGDGALAAVLPQPGTSIGYIYDFGDSWDHTITLERIVERDDGLDYPCCVTGRGDAPVEDRSPDSPEEPIPFDRDLINRELARLAGAGHLG